MEVAALLALLALLFGRKKSESKKSESPKGTSYTSSDLKSDLSPLALPAASLPAPGETVFAKAWKERCHALLKRGTSGAKWIKPLELAIGGEATSAAAAAARWIGMESGGNPAAKSALNERGLAQGMKASYPPKDWTALQTPTKLTQSQSADIAVRLMSRMLDGVKLVEFTAGNLGVAKLYHALPLLVKELRDQKLLKPNATTVIETLAAMLASYKPSARVVAFVSGQYAVTNDPRQNIALRFFAPCAMIAYGDASVTVLDSIAGVKS